MSLELSLFDIETGLRDLYAMREEITENMRSVAAGDGAVSESDRLSGVDECRAELLVIDKAIRDYIGAEIRKADGTADFVLMLDRLCHEPRERKGVQQRCDIDREIDRLKERRDRMREVLRHVKDAVIFVMQGMSWKAGKPRKIEGVRHTLSLQGAVGVQPVEITDESLVPDEYCTAEVRMSYLTWLQLRAARPDGFNTADRLSTVKREISRSAIAEALNKPCPVCTGGAAVLEMECAACGGSGKQGVPGARLAPRADSLVIR